MPSDFATLKMTMINFVFYHNKKSLKILLVLEIVRATLAKKKIREALISPEAH